MSSGDSKSISLEDFFRTLPLLETPVTSRSNEENIKGHNLCSINSGWLLR